MTRCSWGSWPSFSRAPDIRPPDNDLLPYLVARMERSARAAEAMVIKLDEAADAEGRPVGKALARELLELNGELFPE